MKDFLKKIINASCCKFGIRVVNAEWGPRGFGASLQKVKECGIQPGQIIDVGAARGEWTKECLQIFPNAQYFLIDPIEKNAISLKSLQAAHPNIKSWCGALGSQESILQLYTHGDQSSFLKSTTWPGKLKTIEVRMLDSFLDTGIIQPPEFIKVDTQGFELEVLKGAKKCLNSVQLLLLEVSYRYLYEKMPLAHEIIAFIANFGFRIYDICSYVQRPCDGLLVQSDILFAKNGSLLFQHEEWD